MGILSTIAGKPISFGGKLLSVSVAATALALTDYVSSYAPAEPIVQRKAGQTYADIPVLFAYSGAAPSVVQARVVAASDGTVIKDWTTITGLTTASGNGSGLLPGVTQGRGYLLQIRLGTTGATLTGTRSFGVGAIFLWSGQSDMVATMSGFYLDPTPGSSLNNVDWWEANRPGAFFDTGGWHGPGANDGSRGPNGASGVQLYGNCATFLRITAAALAAKYGKPIPVGIIAWMFGATSIGAYITGGNHYTDLFGSTTGLAATKNVYAGDLEGALWLQGAADTGQTTAQYKANLALLHNTYIAFVAPYGRDKTNFYFGIAVEGNYSTDFNTFEYIRLAQMQYAAESVAQGWAVENAWTTIDLVRGPDGLHFNEPYSTRSFRRGLQSVLNWLGCATFSGQGSRVAAVTRSGLVATVTFNLGAGATSLRTLTGSGAPTGFYVNAAADFSGAYAAPTVALAGNTVTLTFAAGTTFPQYLKYLGGKVGNTVVDGAGYTDSCNPNISNAVYGNEVYPSGVTGTDLETFGLPVLPSNGALTIA